MNDGYWVEQTLLYKFQGSESVLYLDGEKEGNHFEAWKDSYLTHIPDVCRSVGTFAIFGIITSAVVVAGVVGRLAFTDQFQGRMKYIWIIPAIAAPVVNFLSWVSLFGIQQAFQQEKEYIACDSLPIDFRVCKDFSGSSREWHWGPDAGWGLIVAAFFLTLAVLAIVILQYRRDKGDGSYVVIH